MLAFEAGLAEEVDGLSWSKEGRKADFSL